MKYNVRIINGSWVDFRCDIFNNLVASSIWEIASMLPLSAIGYQKSEKNKIVWANILEKAIFFVAVSCRKPSVLYFPTFFEHQQKIFKMHNKIGYIFAMQVSSDMGTTNCNAVCNQILKTKIWDIGMEAFTIQTLLQVFGGFRVLHWIV